MCNTTCQPMPLKAGRSPSSSAPSIVTTEPAACPPRAHESSADASQGRSLSTGPSACPPRAHESSADASQGRSLSTGPSACPPRAHESSADASQGRSLSTGPAACPPRAHESSADASQGRSLSIIDRVSRSVQPHEPDRTEQQILTASAHPIHPECIVSSCLTRQVALHHRAPHPS